MSCLPDYQPRKSSRWGAVPESERLKTVAYIIEEWERETPGIIESVDPAQLREDILRFMRANHIQTVEDYEESKIKYYAVDDRDDDFGGWLAQHYGNMAKPLADNAADPST